MLVWAMAFGHDQKERHAFLFDRFPMPVNETKTICGIQAPMLCPDPDPDDRRCEVCQHREESEIEKNPRICISCGHEFAQDEQPALSSNHDCPGGPDYWCKECAPPLSDEEREEEKKDSEDMRIALDALQKKAKGAGPIQLPPQDDGLARKWRLLERGVKMKIAERLGLAKPEERRLEEFQYDRLVFLRVGGYNKTKELHEAIDKAGESI